MLLGTAAWCIGHVASLVGPDIGVDRAVVMLLEAIGDELASGRVSCVYETSTAECKILLLASSTAAQHRPQAVRHFCNRERFIETLHSITTNKSFGRDGESSSDTRAVAPRDIAEHILIALEAEVAAAEAVADSEARFTTPHRLAPGVAAS